MDAYTPVNDGNLQQQYGLNTENAKPAIYEEMPEELSSDNLIRVDKQGNYYNIKFYEDGVVAERLGQAGELLDSHFKKENYGIYREEVADIVSGIANNLEVYQSYADALDYYATEEGRQAFFKESKKQRNYENPELQKVVDKIFIRLQDGVSKVNPDIKDRPYLYFLSPSDNDTWCSYNRVVSVCKQDLLLTGGNEDELAGILAHELGHGENRAVEQGIQQDVGLKVGMNLLGVQSNSDLVNVITNHMKAKGIDQNSEREANYSSFNILVNSGYNPGAFAAYGQRALEWGDDETNPVKEIFNPLSHPNYKEQRDMAAKQLHDYSKGHVMVKDGKVLIDGKEFVKPAAIHDLNMKGLRFMENRLYNHRTGAERAYLIFGNLAKAYHNGLENQSAYVKDGNILMLGNQKIMECVQGDMSAQRLADKLNEMNLSIQKNRSNQKVTSNAMSSEYLKVTNGNDYSYLQTYDADGNKINTGSSMMEPEVKKSMVDFSQKIDTAMREISNIDPSLPQDRAGAQVGKSLAKLLEGKDAITFFRSLDENVNNISKTVLKDIDRQVKEEKKVNLFDKDSSQDSSYQAMQTIEKLGMNYGNQNFSRIQYVEVEHPMYPYCNGKKIEGKDVSKLLSVLSDSAKDETFNNALLGELAKNPEALKNYNEIVALRNHTMANLEKLRVNVVEKRIDFNELDIKRLERESKAINSHLKKVGMNHNEDINFSGKPISTSYLSSFCQDAQSVRTELIRNKIMLEKLSELNPSLDITKQIDRVERDIDKVTGMAVNLKAKVDKSVGPVELGSRLSDFYAGIITKQEQEGLSLDYVCMRPTPVKAVSTQKEKEEEFSFKRPSAKTERHEQVSDRFSFRASNKSLGYDATKRNVVLQREGYQR